MAADPFSMDETTTAKTTEKLLVAPVVTFTITPPAPASQPTTQTSAFVTEITEEQSTMSPSIPVISPTLEGRVLKEKEEQNVPVRATTTEASPLAQTTELPSIITVSTENEEEVRTTTETATAATRADFESEETPDVSAAIDIRDHQNTTVKEPTTSELPPTTTRAASTTASTDLSTTTIDEDAEPFDLEKLSGVFEQDGSFIPDHLVNQPSVEPVFPRVELPEESTELIGGDQRAKQVKTS
ncbi:unnamed protein product [Strongylus vulgaris]|uniref:Uncharacterized protein n=1 Tax=Strongylus vulgaris TaxID=40348 RepID=A0A3P7JUV6_STRVU|nr:unnamed protein product [Strongylus vulgaris]